MFRRRTKLVVETILGGFIIPLLMNIVTGGTPLPFGPVWIVLVILGGGFTLIHWSPEKRSAEESQSAFPTQNLGTREVQTHQAASPTTLFRGTQLQAGFNWIQLWSSMSQGLNTKEVLRRVRKGTAPSTWQVIFLSSLWDLAWPVAGNGCSYGLVGMVWSALIWWIVANFTANNAYPVPAIHNFLTQTGAVGGNVPDWLVIPVFATGGIGVVFGITVRLATYGRQVKVIGRQVLVILPDGFVHRHETGSYAINFRDVAAMEVMPSQDGLLIAPRISKGQKMPLRMFIGSDPLRRSDMLRSIVAAYKWFKTSNPV